MCFPVALVGEPGPEPPLPHPENGPNEGLMAGEQPGGSFLGAACPLSDLESHYFLCKVEAKPFGLVCGARMRECSVEQRQGYGTGAQQKHWSGVGSVVPVS